MPNNPNTDYENESASLDAEDWEIALKPYFGYPDAALDLARNLMTIRECLTTTPPDVPTAVAALNEAADGSSIIAVGLGPSFTNVTKSSAYCLSVFWAIFSFES